MDQQLPGGDRTKMRKVPENSRVRRRLFSEGPNDQATMDNSTNILQELIQMEREKTIKKYNFDSKREVFLEGDFVWYRKSDNSWVGIKPEPIKSESTEDKFIPIEKENQMTPKVNMVGSAPEVRKRKRDGNISVEKVAKRKINFD